MAGLLVSGIRDWTNDQSNGFLRIRAGGVVLGGEALLMPSPPESHLPALVAQLVKSGAGYLGDEIVTVDPVLLHAHPLSLPLLLDPQDIREFPELEMGREKPRRRSASDSPRPRLKHPSLIDVLQHALWAVNQAVQRRVRGYLLLHAGGMARNGNTLLLPAGMESGKSCLVVALADAPRAGRGTYMHPCSSAMDRRSSGNIPRGVSPG